MPTLELKIPPLVLVLLFAFAMWLASFSSAAMTLAPPLRIGLALCFALAGIATCAAGVISFRHARTTVNPMQPDTASSLVKSGIYRFSRNPMYLDFLLILAGWGIFLSNAAALVLATLFVPYLNRFQIGPEERALKQLFGQDFTDYQTRVRRWL